MKAHKIGDRIELTFKYDPRMVAFVKTLPGRQYHAGSKSWSIPFADSMGAIEQLTSYGFDISMGLIEAAMGDKKAAQEAETLAVQNDVPFDSYMPLYPYQKVGAAFLSKVGSGLLGDDMGLGKTIQFLAVAEHVQAQKVLIFAPASVKHQWADEIRKFIAPDKIGSSRRSLIVIDGDKEERQKQWEMEGPRFYICNYELLLRDFEHMNIRIWDLIGADEATRIANGQSKTGKIIKKLRAKRRIAMTGTPISNKAHEVWNIIDFTNPGAFGSYFSFIDRYCIRNHFNAISAYKNMDELSAKLKRYMIRRMAVDVLPDLPPKIVTDIPFELSDEERHVYTNIKKEILFEIEKTDIDKLDNPMTIQYTLVKMTRLRQIADSLELIGQNTKSSKLAVLKDMIPTALEGGRKVIVFTQFSEMAEILARELKEFGPAVISGKVKEEYRDVVARFNEDESVRVLIMTSAGQFGLNIQRASVIFHYDQEWSLAKMLQREGRAHRNGQEKDVFVYNLLARGTLDYYIKKMLHEKAEMSALALGDLPQTMSMLKEALNYEQTIL